MVERVDEPMKQIEVVAAIIHDGKGRFFATQRGYGDYKDGWEFPGGKMEAGELTLKEHEAAKWLTREQLDSVDWLPADRLLLGKIKEYNFGK